MCVCVGGGCLETSRKQKSQLENYWHKKFHAIQLPLMHVQNTEEMKLGNLKMKFEILKLLLKSASVKK